ncbi:MAG: hypothetical protein K8S15_07420 [Candidatus Aegiribacteria sp.]|nr:hypothetical protein [Candidatus Aegiribacteria sp.]
MKTVAAICMLALLCSCGSDTGESEPVEVASADTLHYLVTYDSIGVEMGDSCYVFGDIWGRCVFPDGTIGVLDQSVSTVMFYSAGGDYLREFYYSAVSDSYFGI